MHAAAILHDIAIKYCKEHHYGDAIQEKQKRKPPDLSEAFCPRPIIRHPMFPVSFIELVERHHDYDCPRNPALQLLIEADLIVNCYENDPSSEEMLQIQAAFQSPSGKE